MPKGLRPRFIKMARKAGAKNIFAYAWTLQKRMRGSRSLRVTKRGGSMVRRKYLRRGRRRGRSLSLSTGYKFVRLGAFVLPGLYEATYAPGWSLADRLIGGLGVYAGWNQATKKFEFDQVKKAWVPFITACVLTYGIQKLNGLIRRS